MGVEKDAPATAGEIAAETGSTGQSTGPSLHLETPDLDTWSSRDFRSTVTADGFEVDVVITVAGDNIGPDVYEVGEHAQMTASRVASLGRGNLQRSNVAPFTPAQPPF